MIFRLVLRITDSTTNTFLDRRAILDALATAIWKRVEHLSAPRKAVAGK